MHIHGENIEVAETIGPGFYCYGLSCRYRRCGSRQRVRGGLFPGSSFLHFDNKEGSVFVVFRIIKLRLAFLKALKFYLNACGECALLDESIERLVAAEFSRLPSRSSDCRYYLIYENCLSNDAANAALRQVRGSANCAQDGIRLNTPLLF